MKGGASALYVGFEDDRVKELFDDLNDVRKSENLMKKEINKTNSKRLECRKFEKL